MNPIDFFVFPSGLTPPPPEFTAWVAAILQPLTEPEFVALEPTMTDLATVAALQLLGPGVPEEEAEKGGQALALLCASSGLLDVEAVTERISLTFKGEMFCAWS